MQYLFLMPRYFRFKKNTQIILRIFSHIQEKKKYFSYFLYFLLGFVWKKPILFCNKTA